MSVPSFTMNTYDVVDNAAKSFSFNIFVVAILNVARKIVHTSNEGKGNTERSDKIASIIKMGTAKLLGVGHGFLVQDATRAPVRKNTRKFRHRNSVSLHFLITFAKVQIVYSLCSL